MPATRKVVRVRKDGRCLQCGKPRKMPKSHHSSIPREVYELDPFCSTICARTYYGALEASST